MLEKNKSCSRMTYTSEKNKVYYFGVYCLILVLFGTRIVILYYILKGKELVECHY